MIQEVHNTVWNLVVSVHVSHLIQFCQQFSFLFQNAYIYYLMLCIDMIKSQLVVLYLEMTGQTLLMLRTERTQFV
ncbi:MAG: hypothetical protein EBW14_08035 [Oxalobacteraceae bacterium]|nr:hypothetical protein [Oxalobacteraceae bacterium]